MELKFKVAGRISKPVAEVFEAVVNPQTLSRYFTTGGAKGRMETGVTVYWSFHDFPGRFPVDVVEVVENERIVFDWDSDDPGTPYKTRVTMSFETLEDGRTLVSVQEQGWRPEPDGLNASYCNCSGWMQMLCALKAWTEHGINLREGMFQ
ncbi:MAG: SRPBCC domain-containing protein [Oceanicaulis sp.]|uniref:SRPBCC domain-containing protein n=1 Tax=Glycocaulis sp. TaxID=1969725 RepID=UPI0025BE85B1|nr:SRPBCC domain-containing protein [Glycocaulis sp.]MCC5982394.1 SRPBCC domain-containing protein [Oceanicaulis sp.]MCH8521586.1 SRPBCC domain-containing protein [Glycocaulis sp.]